MSYRSFGRKGVKGMTIVGQVFQDCLPLFWYGETVFWSSTVCSLPGEARESGVAQLPVR